jgi:ABC-type phosphate transport system substrate-binding protein
MSFLRRKSGRVGLRASLVSGAALAALALSALGAGSASAAVKCTGANITGAGSSLQKIAQTEIWNLGFQNEVCNTGTHPTISYESIGSGAGLKKWNSDGVSGSINTGVSFVGSDDGPSVAQLNNIESVAGGAKVAVIPVAQTAISVVAHPPAGCEVEAITNPDLAAVMEGRIANWSKLETAEGSCNSPITRVVRKDASGTSYQFKNYLFQIYKKGLFCTTGGTEGKMSWAEMEPIGPTETPNISWPETCGEKALSSVIRPASTGGGAEVSTVTSTEGSIGYAALPDAKAGLVGKTGSSILEVQNNGQKKGFEAEFANPAAGSSANCSAITYKVPKLSTGLDVDWSQVFGAKPAVGGESYPLCTLTYILAFHGYQAAGFTEAQEVTAADYLNGYLTASTGQAAINSHFYSALPTSGENSFDVQAAAQRASKTISY